MPGLYILENGLLFGPHVSLAVFPVKVGNDGSGYEQAAQQGQVESTAVAILQFPWSTLFGDWNNVVVFCFSLRGGRDRRSSRDWRR